VAWIFGEFRGETNKTVPVLITLLRDNDTSVRRKAAWSLGRIGPDAKRGVPALIEALKDPDMAPERTDVRVSGGAAFALGRIGPEAKTAIPALIAAIQSSDASSRALPIAALVQIAPNDNEVIRTLIQLLSEKQDLGTRADAANALGLVGSQAKDAVPLLIDLLKVRDEKNPSLSATARKIAVSTLGKIGKQAKAAVPAVKEALTDPDPGVRSEAASALERIER
jgi:HEAT repeat protein